MCDGLRRPPEAQKLLSDSLWMLPAWPLMNHGPVVRHPQNFPWEVKSPAPDKVRHPWKRF